MLLWKITTLTPYGPVLNSRHNRVVLSKFRKRCIGRHKRENAVSSHSHRQPRVIIADSTKERNDSLDVPKVRYKPVSKALSSPTSPVPKSITSICVIGASGDLAKKKIFPALFALYVKGSLPENYMIFGYARTAMTTATFRERIHHTLTCRTDAKLDCSKYIEKFLHRCIYCIGAPLAQKANKATFAENEFGYEKLNTVMATHENGYTTANRMFFFSIPASTFMTVARNVVSNATSKTGYTRVVVEKPFGRDLESSRKLSEDLREIMSEEQIYRIDHYLGKELVDNLAVLRFSNTVFEPLWSRKYIRNVQIIFSEPFGTEGRGGYFDQYNIIRDIMQNHLLQVMALFAMEPPVSLASEDIRNEKVKVLRSVRCPGLKDSVLGQYKGHVSGGKVFPSYVDDPTVPNNSICPTFAAVALFIDNARWEGVPFMMKAGKALNKRNAEIRVQFHKTPGQLYSGCGLNDEHLVNELVIHIQPDEEIYLKINNKVPGLKVHLDNSHLNLTYKSRYETDLPDAYERLLLDVMNGDKRLFIRDDELDAAWSIFTPLLHAIDKERPIPEMYPYGSRGPIGAHYLGGMHGVRWGDV